VIPFDEYRQLLEDARLLDGNNPVRVWRDYRGLVAAGLAKACGVTAATVSQIESGKSKSAITLF
jgi:DNA-binding XRE family transcriptional regulator